MVKRIINSFIYTSFFAMLCNLIIEMIVRLLTGFDYSPVTPEYIAMFPSITIAYGVNMLLYGVIGIAFSGFMFVYEKEQIGFVIQSLLYAALTSIVWIPIVWQLWRYKEALLCTIICFVITILIMIVVQYRTTKKNIEKLNEAFTAL